MRRDYLPDDYVADIAGQSVVASVHVEALWDRNRPAVEETAWLAALPRPAGIAARCVAAAPLIDPDLFKQLDAQAAFPMVAGIRETIRSIDSRNDGALTAQQNDGAAVTLPYVPGQGPALPVLLSATEGRSSDDQRGPESQVLTWTTAPLPVATEVTGHPHVSLWASSDTSDGDMVFSLDDVAPDGGSHQVIQGYLNVPHQRSSSAPIPLVPNQAQKIDVDLLPTAYVFQPGHRMRLALAGAASVVAGLTFPQGPGPSLTAFSWTVLQDRAHPATLTLPIIGTAGEALSQLTVAQQ